MSKLLRIAGLSAVGFVVFAPLALAQDAPDTPPGDPEAVAIAVEVPPEWQAQFDQALAAMWDEAGLTGEPGDIEIQTNAVVEPGQEGTLLETIIAEATAAPPSGGGSSLTGPCMGVGVSFAEDGSVVDVVADFSDPSAPVDLKDGGQAGTAGNPFVVDTQGFIIYAGIAEPGPLGHTWDVNVQGVPVRSGGDDNPEQESRNAGSINLVSSIPVGVDALFRIDGKMTAQQYGCAGDGYFKTINGVPGFQIVGGLLMALGLGGIVFNARPARTW